MAQNFHEALASDHDIPLPSDRSTGLVLATAALASAYLWRSSVPVLATCLTLAVGLAWTSLLAPGRLRPLTVAWMRLGLAMHKVVNPIVMLALYAVAIVPAGLLMQRRRDPLVRQRSTGRSYWIDVSQRDADGPTSSMRNQF